MVDVKQAQEIANEYARTEVPGCTRLNCMRDLGDVFVFEHNGVPDKSNDNDWTGHVEETTSDVLVSVRKSDGFASFFDMLAKENLHHFLTTEYKRL